MPVIISGLVLLSGLIGIFIGQRMVKNRYDFFFRQVEPEDVVACQTVFVCGDDGSYHKKMVSNILTFGNDWKAFETDDGCQYVLGECFVKEEGQRSSRTDTKEKWVSREELNQYEKPLESQLNYWKITQRKNAMENQPIDIETRWAAQLCLEHEALAWRYGVSLETPIINISSGESSLGWWNFKTHTISISSHLIKTEAWDIVLEVLKHEMAHQYVSTFYDNADIHGHYFKLACKKLGVHRAFVTGKKDYNQRLQAFKGELPADAQKMLRKVEKLMALGQSNNQAEAQAASRKANYLLNKYNLGRIDAGDADPNIRYLTICHKKKRIESIQKALLAVLRDYYYVNCVTSRTYHAYDDTVYKSIVLIGRKEALIVAEYVYYFLLDTGRTLWQDFKHKQGGKRNEKISFDMGFTAGIRDNHELMFANSKIKIKGDLSLPVNVTRSLMAQNHEENRQEESRLFPRLRSGKYGRHQSSSGAFKEGFKNGKNTHVSKGVTSRGTGVAGLLAGSG